MSGFHATLRLDSRSCWGHPLAVKARTQPTSRRCQCICETETGFLVSTKIQLLEWWELLLYVVETLAPHGLNSIFLPSVLANNLTSIRIAYYDSRSHCAELIPENYFEFPKPNTPAGDHWLLYLVYTKAETLDEVQ